MGRTQKKETKRENERLVQAWFHEKSPDDAEVLKALDIMREKYGWTVKQVISRSILITAQSKGVAVDTPLSMTQINRMFKKILGKIDGLVSSGQLSHEQAANLSPLFGEELRYEDFDPLAKSLTGNYTGFQLDDSEDED